MFFKEFDFLIDNISLPDGVMWHEVQGQRVFPIYDPDWAITLDSCLLLLQDTPEGLKGAGIRVGIYERKSMTLKMLHEKVQEAMERMEIIKDGKFPPIPERPCVSEAQAGSERR